jgi:protein SCO1/2
MVHVIGRGGRHAAIFHGGGFSRINMVLYINGLTNTHPPEPGLLDRILGVFQ